MIETIPFINAFGSHNGINGNTGGVITDFEGNFVRVQPNQIGAQSLTFQRNFGYRQDMHDTQQNIVSS